MTILVATDLSDNSRAAVQFAHGLAAFRGEELAVVQVVELWERDLHHIMPSFEVDEIRPSEHATTRLREWLGEVLDHPSIPPSAQVYVGHPPPERILEAADEFDASIVVTGTSGHTKLSERFFGSTVGAVVRASRRPVLAVPAGAKWVPIQQILAPVDLSDCSRKSLALAAELAARAGAKLTVLHAAPLGTPTLAPPLVYIPESIGQVRAASKARLEEFAKEVGAEDAELLAEVGPPHVAILDAIADQKADLLVLGTHGRTGAARFFLGSTAERVLRARPCPMLVVPNRPTE